MIFKLPRFSGGKDYEVIGPVGSMPTEDEESGNFTIAAAASLLATMAAAAPKVTLAAGSAATNAMASPEATINSAKMVAEKTALSHVLDPLFVVLQGLAGPVFTLMVLAGLVMVMIGRKHRGLEMIKWAVIGFLGIQILPALTNIVMQVGTEMAKIN